MSSSPPIISVEIPLFLFFIALGIFQPAQQEFVYERLCLYKFNQNAALCDNLDSDPSLRQQEALVQADYSTFSTLQTLLTFPPAMIMTICMGMWADRFSHRLALISPHLGSIVLTSLYMAYFYAPTLSETVNPIFLSVLSPMAAFSGYVATMIMAASSYISNITTGQNRTARLGVVQGCVLLGGAVGFILSGFCFSSGNYMLAFIVQICINLYGIVTAWIFVPELKSFAEVSEKVQIQSNGSWCRYLCSPQLIVLDSVKLVFKLSSIAAKYRLGMLFTYALAAAIIGIFSLQNVTYAFLTLQPISITKSLYALSHALYNITTGLMLTIGLRFMRKSWCFGFFPWTDAAIACFGALSRILALITLGFGEFYPELAAWIYAVVNMGAFLAMVSLRSGMSKLTEPQDQGRLFAVVAVVENAFILAAGMSFPALYGAIVSDDSVTHSPLVQILHGYVFFFAAGLALVLLLIIVILGKKPIPGWSFESSAESSLISQ